MKKIIAILFIFFFYTTTFSTGYAQTTTPCTGTAANCYKFLAPLSAGTTPVPPDLEGYLKTMFIIIMSLASVIAVLMIVYGGITYMSSDAIYNKSEGKEIIKRTLWGMAIILSAWLILYTINSNILKGGSISSTIKNISNNFPDAYTGNAGGGISDTQISNGVGPLNFNVPQGGGVGGNTNYGTVGYNGTVSGSGGYSSGGGTGTAGTNIPIDGSGYTTIPTDTPVGSHTVYVSASAGNDGNQGTENAPYQTIEKAIATLTNNTQDRVLLKKGDTWTAGDIGISKSGASSDDRIVFGSYGSGERPLIQVPVGKNGITISGNTHNIVLVGLHLIGAQQNSERGINMIGAAGARDILIEDCYIEGFQEGISLDANGTNNIVANPIRNVVIRRSIIANNYPKNASKNSEGIYAAGTTGLVIEENTLDHNGWKEGGTKTIFNHNIYLQQNSLNATVRKNIIARGASHGLQLRGGGTMENNLFIDNAYNAFIDQAGTVKNNVVIGSHDIQGSVSPGGSGIEILRIRAHDVSVDHNLIVHKGTNFAFPTLGGGISLGGASKSCHLPGESVPADCDPAAGSSLNNISITNNIIYDWPGDFKNDPQKPTSNISITNNSWNSQAPSYPHSDYTLGTYNATLGGSANTEGFIAGALLQSKDHWSPAYAAATVNDYMRSGFGM